jgi:hypothetical protein
MTATAGAAVSRRDFLPGAVDTQAPLMTLTVRHVHLVLRPRIGSGHDFRI